MNIVKCLTVHSPLSFNSDSSSLCLICLILLPCCRTLKLDVTRFSATCLLVQSDVIKHFQVQKSVKQKGPILSGVKINFLPVITIT